MKRISIIVAAALALAACNKPSESDCRRALLRIRELTGTANIQGTGEMEAAVRTCRGNSSKASVKCALEASSVEQLERCGLVSPEELEVIKAEQAEELKKQKEREKAPAPKKVEPPKTEPAPAKTEPAKTEPAKTEPAKTEPATEKPAGSAAPK